VPQACFEFPSGGLCGLPLQNPAPLLSFSWVREGVRGAAVPSLSWLALGGILHFPARCPVPALPPACLCVFWVLELLIFFGPFSPRRVAGVAPRTSATGVPKPSPPAAEPAFFLTVASPRTLLWRLIASNRTFFLDFPPSRSVLSRLTSPPGLFSVAPVVSLPPSVISELQRYHDI